ncbi:MAG: 30S ribosomal protein S12 methylthiotransferase RimO [Thermanaerothrix sp.]|uniref:Ribosomal protein uS12 methylthiotransferase RimO n=1 Tax=Thermanaerothrix solaris TaxID=3058434 RepID=A0ABU3NIN4_9CHLR|nr:30S ribosomal protein S12 methylthiotransferase RimO [Thermanaerothrix sp. 4228-RoL]MDT8896720.1 30S ribosomal protein S12 methylthiotransferase RimO [Thermanaerothrix sp. 4228-RoL]
MSEKTFYLVSLGCAKNTVDSHSMAALLQRAGYEAVDNPRQAQFLIVNTCGFIQPAREESIKTLTMLARKKRKGQYLIATGCLTQRYREQVARDVPGLDGMLGTRRWMDILDLVERLNAHPPQPLYHLPDTPTVGRDERGVLRAAIQGTSAYLKIADGCRRPCAFCAIPLIKGTLVSRPMDVILEEARQLQAAGVKELILIAQDTTDYGHDLGLQDGLALLLENLVKTVPDIPWIRLLYTYPGAISDRLIELMASQPQIVHYLDIPLQHAHPDILRKMRRPANIDWVYRTLEKMRRAMPDLAIRSTFIVGYPGETEAEFQTLLDFLAEVRLDRVGAFTFSFEPGTASEPLGDPVPPEVKQARYNRLMELQSQISLSIHQSLIGKHLEVLIEGANQDLSVGRSYRDAPEVDGLVLIPGQFKPGEMIRVTVDSALPNDLIAHPAS